VHIIRTDKGRDLVDRRILAFTTGYAVATIRKHLEPDACDLATRAVLYDRDRALEALDALGVEPRPDRRGERRHVHDARPGRIA
jgi:hypothetical protein